ncbi:MAG: T9SS type A sorting domain-containing protein [Chitinophagaceae bacterium]
MRILYIFILILGFGFHTVAQKQPVGTTNQVKMLKFFPNPATTAINFDFQRDYNNTYTLQIYNFMGKKVFDLKKPSNNVRVDLENFYRGMYIYQLRDKNGFIVDSGKFQVIK